MAKETLDVGGRDDAKSASRLAETQFCVDLGDAKCLRC